MAKKDTPPKAQMIREAMQELGDAAPGDIQDWIKAKYDLEIDKPYISTAKVNEKKRLKQRNSPKIIAGTTETAHLPTSGTSSRLPITPLTRDEGSIGAVPVMEVSTMMEVAELVLQLQKARDSLGEEGLKKVVQTVIGK